MEALHDIQIGIIEDDRFILRSLTRIINNAPGLRVSYSFTNAEDALKGLKDVQLDVLLLDIDLPGISGVEALPKLRELLPETNIVMLTVHEESDIVFSALRNGAVGYLVKGNHSQELLDRIEEVVDGGAPMSPSIARQVISSFSQKNKSELSKRELEVLQKLSGGSNNKQIAEELFVSTNTVKAHIKNIYKKMHVNTRAEAISKAMKKGWI